MTKKIGKQYRFVYPNSGTPSGSPKLLAHSGQVATVEEIGYSDFGGYYRVSFPDGWTGWAMGDELNPLHPRKGNIVRVNQPKYVNELYRVESMGRKSVTLRRLGDNALMANCRREWL